MAATEMFLFFVRKVLTFILLPVGLTVLLLAAALLFKRLRLVAAALIVVGLTGMPLVGDLLIGVLEGQYPRVAIQECPRAEAIVVLGGIVHGWIDGRRVAEWSEAVDRYEQGVLLKQAGKAPLLVLSGGRLRGLSDEAWEGEAMRQSAIVRGVKADEIRVVRDVAVTADEARAVAALGFERVVLVTSAFHMPRSVFLFQKAGLEVVPFPVDYQTHERFEFDPLQLVPNADGLGKSERAMKEFYGLLYYRLTGGAG